MEGREKWLPRTIRMPDDLWYKLALESARRKIPTSELVRELIVKQLETEEG